MILGSREILGVWQPGVVIKSRGQPVALYRSPVVVGAKERYSTRGTRSFALTSYVNDLLQALDSLGFRFRRERLFNGADGRFEFLSLGEV